MDPIPLSDEAALRAAVEVAPADDAPWLVYADWLDDHGRDREAAAVRRFLPDIRAELSGGPRPSAVWDRLARQDPGGAGWGLGPPIATPPEVPAIIPAGPNVPAGGPGPGIGPWLACVLVVKAAVLLAWAVARGPADQPDRPAPPNLKQFLTEDQLKYSRVVKDGKEYITFPIRSRPPDDRWHPAELPGYTLRVLHAQGLVAVAFRADGRATAFNWPCPGVGFPAVAAGRWEIDNADGVLTITAPAGADPVRVQKLRGAGDYYQVTWDGRPLVLGKVKSNP